jgi:cell division protein FtsL
MAIKNNIIKKNAKPQTRGLTWIIFICLIFGELLAYTWVRTESTHTILRVSKAQENLVWMKSYNKALSVERDRLKSDDRITRIAKSKLNLSTDTSNPTIYLSGDEG